MEFLTESYKVRLQQLAGIISLDEDVKISRSELYKAYEGSGARIRGFDVDALKQAIYEGRAIGILYKSEKMPVQKYRVILPVTLGQYKTKSGVLLKLSAFHLGGQSEKAAKGTGTRSEETDSVWRLFDLDTKKFKGLWFTDYFFYENPPGYKKGDKRFSSIQAAFDPRLATLEREKREKTGKEQGKPLDLTTLNTPETPQEKPAETLPRKVAQPAKPAEEPTQPRQEFPEEPLQEKERNALYVKKPWLKYLRKGFLDQRDI